jgi:hypothetical protein
MGVTCARIITARTDALNRLACSSCCHLNCNSTAAACNPAGCHRGETHFQLHAFEYIISFVDGQKIVGLVQWHPAARPLQQCKVALLP